MTSIDGSAAPVTPGTSGAADPAVRYSQLGAAR
jgi:hypothetical protein